MAHGIDNKMLHNDMDEYSPSGGEPRMEEEWGRGRVGRMLTLGYRMPGYDPPIWVRPSREPQDEFAYLVVEEQPDGWWVSEVFRVDDGFQRMGYGRRLMARALELVRGAGGRGIKSRRGYRSNDADSFWGSVATGSDGDFDYLEGFRRWLDDGGF